MRMSLSHRQKIQRNVLIVILKPFVNDKMLKE